MEELMRYDLAAKKLTENLAERETKQQGPLRDTEVHTKMRIPFKIDDAIMVCSMANTTQMAKARIVGSVHGKYILITEPTAKVSERMSAVLDRDFLCSYFNNGFLHIFCSKYQRHLTDDVVCIEYPASVEVRQIRKHRRIRVNIGTEFTIAGAADVFPAEIVDISQDGCCMILNQSADITKGTNISLTFNLPNEASVSGLQTVFARTCRIQNSPATEVGVSFSGPENEISKILNFCQFCMFFDVEESSTQG